MTYTCPRCSPATSNSQDFDGLRMPKVVPMPVRVGVDFDLNDALVKNFVQEFQRERGVDLSKVFSFPCSS